MPLERLPPLLFSRCVSVFRRLRLRRHSFRRGREFLVVSRCVVRRFSPHRKPQQSASVGRLDAILFQNSERVCAAMRDERNTAKTSRRGPLLRRASGRQQTRRTRTTCRREREKGLLCFLHVFFCAEKKTSKMTLRSSIIKRKKIRAYVCVRAFLCGKEERMSIVLTSKMTLRSKRLKREKRRARTRAKKESYSI